ncbi:MAG: hypothetical protein ABIM32_03590 [candidate division WOR-3 bacterium]
MNPLKEWAFAFKRKRSELLLKHKLKTAEEISQFFRYTNLSRIEPDFCPLFKSKEVCHERPKLDDFNCYYCACPFFDYEYWNEELKEFGRCTFGSALGKYNEHGYWDCTNCSFVHKTEWVKNRLKKEFP